MRLYLSLSPNEEIIPYNYQPLLTGAIHKWMGKDNFEHGKLSLYSFSWLQNVNTSKKGISLSKDSHFFISAFNDELIKTILKNITIDPSVCSGSEVTTIQIKESPQFRIKETFQCASPIFIKRRIDNEIKHIDYTDKLSGTYLTETMIKKLASVGVNSSGLTIEFDNTYSKPQSKLIHYKNILNKASICPVIIEGTPDQIAFAWNVGIGNSTGIGFGALK